MNNLFCNGYPYTDFHELNLSWVVKKIVELNTKLTEFVSLNTIKYADPIQWNITTQYGTNTVVIDPVSGVAYLSVKPVPMGVSLSDTDYWTEIFDLGQIIGNINQNLTVHNDGYSTTSTFDLEEGDWVLWNGVLYRAMHHIDIGDAYVPDANIEKKSVEELVVSYVEDLERIILHVEDLVASEVTARADADDVLRALIEAEVEDREDADDALRLDLSDLITSKVGIEAQAREDADDALRVELSDLITSNVGVINGKIGNLQDLDTTDKDSIVDAINEVNSRALGNLDKADIRNYGGVADGTTDNTDAFNACMADNNVVYLPRYNNQAYHFTSKLVITSGSSVIGDEGTQITAPNVTDLFEITGTYVTIKNLRITTVSNIFYINSGSNPVQYVNIENIIATNANMFMHDNTSATYKITNLYVDKCYSFANVSYGVYMTKAFAFIFFNNVTIIEIGTTATTACFYFVGCEGLHMTHCEAEGGLTDGTHTGHLGFSFVNCQAIWLERCMADTVDSHGFVISNSNYVYMNSCVSSLCGGHGIAILGTTSRRILITNCYIGGRRTLSPAPAGAHGIYNYNDQVSVSNCEIGYMTGYAIANNSQGYSTRYAGITAYQCQSAFYSSAGHGIITNLIDTITGDSPTWGAFSHTDNLINGVFG